MNHTAWAVLLLVLAAVCFAVAAFAPERPPLAPYRLRFVAGGLLLWVVEAVLTVAKVL